MKRRLRRDPYLDSREFHDLARYNDEVAHGLIHTAEWRERMAAAQARFDAWSAATR